jgi:hypothetical protein
VRQKDCKPNSDQHTVDEPGLLHYGDFAVLDARHTTSGQRKRKRLPYADSIDGCIRVARQAVATCCRSQFQNPENRLTQVP